MASIVKRNKSFSVVYTSYEGGKKKQRWETYHSYEAALHRKEQVELIQAKQKERLQSHADNLMELLEEYVELYGRAHWSYSTYSNHQAKQPVNTEEKAKGLVKWFLDSVLTSRKLLVSLIERVELSEKKESIIKFRFHELEAIS